MVFFNYATMQMAAKIVYYGPGLCGKTTNLQQIYAKTSPQSRGEMVSLETETDRTLFFDLLPIDVGVIGGFKTRLQLYTVPGQVFYNTTRKLVLKGVDGIVFVADSQVAMLDANADSLRNLRENLGEIGLNLDELPVVIQLNKRDLPNINPVETILDALDPERRFEHVEAIAATGTGVFETLKLISKSTLRTLRRRMTGDEPVRQPTRPAAQFRIKDDHSRTVAGTTPLPPVPAPPTFTTPAPAAAVPRAESAATMVATPVEEIEQPAPPIAPPLEGLAPAPLPVEDVAAAAPTEETAPPMAEPIDPSPAPAVVDEPAPPADEETIAAAVSPSEPTLDEIITAAPPEPEPLFAAPPPEAAAPVDLREPEIEIPRVEPQKAAEPAPVKTVKVRSSVDVMAELEALRKRATNTTAPRPSSSRRDPMADLAALRPRKEISRTLHLDIPADLLPRSKAVRVTLSFEDGEQGVLETREQQLDLGDTSDAQSLSVNLKIDLA